MRDYIPKGKGMFIWNVLACEGGNINSIVSAAELAGLEHVIVKGADGAGPYNVSTNLPDLVDEFHAAGIDVLMYQYAYGNSPAQEGAYGAKRYKEADYDGFVVDVEKEFKTAGPVAAKTYMDSLRTGLQDVAFYLSSYRWPSYHNDFPWAPFVAAVDGYMPQVYWESAHDPAVQLARSYSEYLKFPSRPFIPTGAAYRRSILWAANEVEVRAFLEKAYAMGLDGANFWEWSNCRKNLPKVWDAIMAFPWPVSEPPAPPPDPEIIERLDLLELQMATANGKIDQLNLRVDDRVAVDADLYGKYTNLDTRLKAVEAGGGNGTVKYFVTVTADTANGNYQYDTNKSGYPMIQPWGEPGSRQQYKLGENVQVDPKKVDADGSIFYYKILQPTKADPTVLYLRAQDVTVPFVP